MYYLIYLPLTYVVMPVAAALMTVVMFFTVKGTMMTNQLMDFWTASVVNMWSFFAGLGALIEANPYTSIVLAILLSMVYVCLLNVYFYFDAKKAWMRRFG